MSEQVKNTDKEIWRGKSRAEFGDDDRFYADSLSIPASNVEALTIHCGGFAITKPIREWHRLASEEISVCPTCHGEGDNCRDPFHDDVPWLARFNDSIGRWQNLSRHDKNALVNFIFYEIKCAVKQAKSKEKS